MTFKDDKIILSLNVAFLFIASVFNILVIYNEETVNMIVLILGIFYIPFILDIFMIKTYTKSSFIIRRFSYGLIFACFLGVVVLFIFNSFYDVSGFLRSSLLLTVIVFSFIIMIISRIYFTYIYATTEEEIHGLKVVQESHENAIRRKKEYTEDVKRQNEEKNRDFKREKGNKKVPKKDKIQGGGLR